MKKTTLLALLFFSALMYAQNPYTIQFQDEIIEIPENINSFNWNELPESAVLEEGYIGWIQFYETPTQDIQDLFKANDLRLLEYIPHKAYLFYFPLNTSMQLLKDSGVRGITPVEGRFKMGMNLKNGIIGDWAIQGNNILVTLEHHPYVSQDFVVNDLARKQIAVNQLFKNSEVLYLTIPNNCLEDLSNLPYVKWVELIPAPDVKEDTRGKSLHRSHSLDTQTPTGWDYTGEGVGVLVRDDGIIGPHIDFHGRIDNSGASGTGQNHGDGVAGILAGAGNLNPNIRGMAAGSNVFVSNYASSFLDGTTTSLINSGDVQITNSSYGNGCNAGYTSIARTVDLQTNTTTSLLHVFSCGNSNGNNCGYGAGTQWGTITGGHKQGKNVIATANTFFDGSLAGSSSWGPASDGRIKPDITANGQGHLSTDENNGYLSFGGTSGASPGIAGVSAQLYQMYAEANGGTLPQSALIKATLLNTANDAGNVGPDFKFGWGIVNGRRAGMLIDEGRFLSSTITQGNTNSHTINVPAGTTQARFMVYWNDPAGASGANPSLVNDLDLVVNDPVGASTLPYILDPTPNATTLDLPATNGEDHLNNMEQVVYNDPMAGDYTINIDGFNIPSGPQEYFVVYEIISENLTVTYPNSGENFVPGQAEALHWDAVNTTDGFTLEYSTDNGGSWNPITTVDSTTYLYMWNVPNTISGTAKIRVTSGAFQDESDESFSIASLVEGVELAQLCPDQAIFSWDTVPDAESYDLYLLGDKYMEVAGTSTTNEITVAITDPNEVIWYTVVAKNATEGWEGRRNIAIQHPGGLVNCSLANDLAMEEIYNSATDFSDVCIDGDGIVSVAIRNTGVSDQTGFTIGYQVSGQAPVEETFAGNLTSGQSSDYEFATPITISDTGNYSLTTYVALAGDQNASNDEAVLDFYVQSEPIQPSAVEDFDSTGVPPDGWFIDNPDEALTWTEATGVTGSDGNATNAAFVNNFSYNAAGQEDALITPFYEIPTIALFSFDLAKAQFSAEFSDALRVEISIDCGLTFTEIWAKDGLDLSTLPNYVTSNWSPNNEEQWRLEQIDVSQYSGEIAQFRIVNITGYGNGTYIDNIFVEPELRVEDVVLNDFAIYPNPASDLVFLRLPDISNGDATIAITNSLGQKVFEFGSDTGLETSFDVSKFASGLYFVSVKIGDEISTKKLLIE